MPNWYVGAQSVISDSFPSSTFPQGRETGAGGGGTPMPVIHYFRKQRDRPSVPQAPSSREQGLEFVLERVRSF